MSPVKPSIADSVREFQDGSDGFPVDIVLKLSARHDECVKHRSSAPGAKVGGMVFACLLVALIPVLAVGESTDASAVQNIRRLGGSDRYSTAVAVSNAFYPSTVDTVVLATGQDFADSLSGSALAAQLDAPLLLATWGTIPSVTQNEIKRLSPTQVIVLGGTNALSQIVEAQLSELGVGNVVRLAGKDRYETSAKISEFGWPTANSFTSRRLYLASGLEYGPGLIAGAAAGRVDSPVLLSRTSQLPPVIANEIARLRPTQVVQIGYGSGSGTIADSVGSSASNLVGASRVVIHESTLNELSAVVAEQTPSRGLLAPVALLASSENFPDALAAGAAAGAGSVPLLMTSRWCLSKRVSEQLALYKTSSLLVVGLSAAISDAAANGSVCSSTPPITTPPVSTTINPPTSNYRTTCSVSPSLLSSRTSPAFLLRLTSDSSGNRVPALYSKSYSYSISTTAFVGSYFGSGWMTEAANAFGGQSLNAYFSQASSVTTPITYSITVNFADGARCSASLWI